MSAAIVLPVWATEPPAHRAERAVYDVQQLQPTLPKPRKGKSALGTFRAPNRGLPGSREGGATRGCPAYTPALTMLTPLTPEGKPSNYGTTLKGHPEFLWFTPTPNAQLEFKLNTVDDEGIDQLTIYKTSLVAQNAGIQSLSLPQEVSALAVGPMYRWSVAMICNPEDRSGDIIVEGWLQRVESSPDLSAALAQSAGLERLDVYAKAGLWYDLVGGLATLRQTSLTDPTLADQWSEVLTHVGLGNLASQPLLCTGSDSICSGAL